MTGTTDTAPNLAMLEEVLSAVHDKAKSEYPFLAQVMSEAVQICQSRHTVRAGVSLQLQAALASIRTGRPDDATRYIELALAIEDAWNCRVMPGLESTAEFPQLEKTVGSEERTPRESALRLIAALLALSVGVVVFAANIIVRALLLATRPFAYVADRGNALHGALQREMDRPS